MADSLAASNSLVDWLDSRWIHNSSNTRTKMSSRSAELQPSKNSMVFIGLVVPAFMARTAVCDGERDGERIEGDSVHVQGSEGCGRCLFP